MNENELDILERREKEIESEKREVVGKIEKRDPNYMYYVDSEGNVLKSRKGGPRKKSKKKKKEKPLEKEYHSVDINLPKLMFSSYVSNGFKKIGKFSNNSGYLFVHKALIGREFKVILIPKTEWGRNAKKS